jgi:hypothetical protein
MVMTRFQTLADPRFVAVAEEIRRLAKALVVSADNFKLRQRNTGSPLTYHNSPEAADSVAKWQILRVTQGGSEYNRSITVTGGSVFLGNYIG